MSNIEWTEKTWNPTVGCTEVSPGCTNCYAAKMAWRLQHMPNQTVSKDYAGTVKKLDNGKLVWTGKVNMLQHRLREVIHNKKPTVYFVDSMSDLFHKDVPLYYIDQVYATMAIAHWHTFQILTKRPDRMLAWYNHKDTAWANEGMQGDERIRFQTYHTYGKQKQISPDKWHWPLKNVWIGTSVENQKAADERIPFLLQVPAAVRFLSCEPLLGPVSIDFVSIYEALDPRHGRIPSILGGINWVIVGGESGSGARPMHPDWARALQHQCQEAGVAFFFKQWGNWLPIDMPHNQETIAPLKKNEQWLNQAGGQGFHGEAVYRMRNVGKHDAGRLLDGKEYNELPVKSGVKQPLNV